MAQVDYSPLDAPEISMNSFYPRQGWTHPADGVQDYTINVGDDIGLSCRFFPAGSSAPTILFFYGNGETAIDYNSIAPLYNQIGVNFFVADYRGYGKSGGSPSFTTMLTDASTVLEAMSIVLGASGYNGPVFVMGRSMGRPSAFELAAKDEPGDKKRTIHDASVNRVNEWIQRNISKKGDCPQAGDLEGGSTF